MNKQYEGKKILFLGAIALLCEAVEIAKKMGMYTIVIDYYPDSPAKKVADESHLLSTTDVDAVVKFCKENKVDGVFTAFIDSMLPYAREICDRLNLPFYASKEQIRMSLDKSFFKETCNKFSVPVPYDYTGIIIKDGIDKCEITYPVIVKPTDSSGGRGIKVCSNSEELKDAYDYAMSVSPGKHVLVEEYVVGDEITATYTMKNGEVSLSCFRDKLISCDHPNITSQGDVLVNPSAYIEQFIKNVDPYIRNMLKGMNATDGTVFFQGVANKEKIILFELGYRPNGACDYRHISKQNKINYMEMMLAHAVTGNMEGYELSLDNPRFKEYSVTFNLWLHGGKINYMDGIDKVKKLPSVQFCEYTHNIGDEIKDNNTLSQRGFRAIINETDIQKLKDTITEIQSYIKINDETGKSMLYKPFNVERLNVYPNK